MTRLPSAAWLLSPRQGPILILTIDLIMGAHSAVRWALASQACTGGSARQPDSLRGPEDGLRDGRASCAGAGPVWRLLQSQVRQPGKLP